MGEHEAARERLIEAIRREMAATAELTGEAEPTPELLAALRRVPREQFVPDMSRDAAYLNQPLGIGHGQTISQPYIVALMTALLAPRAEHVVLEVGTGSGYQAAVLACLVRQVYSIEVIPELARTARERLARLGFTNVEVLEGDGREGWREHAPYDGIIVTAAGEDVPAPLLAQLASGGRLVIPLGRAWWGQELTLLEKDADGELTRKRVLPVSFVPLVQRDEGPDPPGSGSA